jgi:hypothetical protein
MSRLPKSNTEKPRKRGAARNSGLPKSHIAAAFKNRIVSFELVDPRTIKRNPLNWRTHPDQQRAAMRDALEQLGYIDTCLVSHRTRMLIDGEMRLDIAIENNEPTVPVLWVDLTPDEEKLALAIVNPMAELAGVDPEALAKLLRGHEPAGGPLDELLASLSTMAESAIVKPTKNTGARAVGKSPGHVLRVVFAVPETADFERAIAATGIINRGEAVLELARYYLTGHDTERQHDATAQSGTAAQLAEAVRAGLPARRS